MQLWFVPAGLQLTWNCFVQAPTQHWSMAKELNVLINSVALFVTTGTRNLGAACSSLPALFRSWWDWWFVPNLGKNPGGLCCQVWAHSRTIPKWPVKYKTTSAQVPFWASQFWGVLCHVSGSSLQGHPNRGWTKESNSRLCWTPCCKWICVMYSLTLVLLLYYILSLEIYNYCHYRLHESSLEIELCLHASVSTTSK